MDSSWLYSGKAAPEQGRKRRLIKRAAAEGKLTPAAAGDSRLGCSRSGPVERSDRPIIRNLAGMRPDHPIRWP